MLQNFNVPGQTGKPYTVKAILDGKVIAKGECKVNAFTYMAYKACYDDIPAEHEPRIKEIKFVNQGGDIMPLDLWLEMTEVKP